MADSFKSPGYTEQAAVKGFIPVPGQPDFGEGRIECRAMSIAFSVREGTVDVENECAQMPWQFHQRIE
jgi:hypothetical protein